jgi:hypothetical protein
MSEETLDRYEDTPPRRFRSATTWIGLLTLAYILYEITTLPALGIGTLCLKFGWEDFTTARWLLRFDPSRARGWACWWMYVSWGFFKTMVAALVSMYVFGSIFTLLLFLANPAAIEELKWFAVGTAVSFALAACLSVLAGCVTFRLAKRHRLKLWLNRSATNARVNRVWPPCDTDPTSRNQLLVLLIMSKTLIVQIPGVVLFAMGMPLWLYLLASLAMLFVCRQWTRAELVVIANSAAECWPPDELAALPDDPVK